VAHIVVQSDSKNARLNGLLDRYEHPNPKRYSNQRVFVVAVRGYACVVPFVDAIDHLFLKTIVPSKTRRRQMSEDERLALAYERGELRRVPLTPQDREQFRASARATLLKDRRVNIRLPSPILRELQARAAEEGLPYQTLIASVLHKFVHGRLVERPARGR
jgi:predicted DNA binding CopG/RHH family protein